MAKMKSIKIGGASGYWGDAALAAPQLLTGGELDYLVFDYLAEITMGILARMRARDPEQGFAVDFVTQAMAPNLAKIASDGVKVVSNAGGVNPNSCARALRKEIAHQGLNLKVIAVCGDDLIDQVAKLASCDLHDMFSGAAFPGVDNISSINAYLGAFPIAEALNHGADIVVTGRCVDSAVTLGAAIHAFGWQAQNFDLLAAGALAGHILECGTQATGGNFTDWKDVADGIHNMGYPIAEVFDDGRFIVSKPSATGGKVSIGTVAEQMVYEIGDPQDYRLPDVTCDFSNVVLSEIGVDQVEVTGAKGRAPDANYKTCLTWQDGFRGGHLFGYYGDEAEAKADAFADAVLKRTRALLASAKMPDFSETSVEILGAESQFGRARLSAPAREVNVKIAVKHIDARGVGAFLKEATGLGLSAPPGLSGFAGARPKPTPVMALFSFLVPKDEISVTLEDGEISKPFSIPVAPVETGEIIRPIIPAAEPNTDMVDVPLIQLAWARSGDKGDSANIGVIARNPDYLPYIWAALNSEKLKCVYGHFLKGDILRYILPGSNAMNIVLTQSLGGGGSSSLRNDPQGKGYAQLLLPHSVAVPQSLLNR